MWALVDAADFTVGLVGLLLAIAGDLILTAIGRAIGERSIGPFSFNIGGIFESLGTKLLGIATDLFVGPWEGVANWIYTHAYLVYESIANAARAISHLGDQIAYLYNTRIPEMLGQADYNAQTAVNAAENLVAEQVDYAADVAGQLYLPADWAPYNAPPGGGNGWWRAVLASVAGGVGAAAAFATSTGQEANQHTEARTQQAEARATAALGETRIQLGSSIAKASQEASEALGQVTTSLTSEIRAVEGQAATELKKAVTRLEGLISSAEGTARTQLEQAKGRLESLVAAAEGTAQRRLEAQRVILEGQIATAEGTARTQLQQEATHLGELITMAQETAKTQLKDARGQLEGLITSAEGAARTQLQQALAPVNEKLAQLQPLIIQEEEGLVRGVYQDLTGAAAAIGGDLSSLEGLLALAITAPILALGARVTHLEECAVTECPGPNNLEGLLEGIMGIAGIAAFAPWLKEVYEHPYAAAPAGASLLTSTYTTGRTVFDTLLSGGTSLMDELDSLLSL